MSTAVLDNPSILTSTFAGLSVYWSFIRNAFLTMLAYRMRYYTGILTYLLFVTVHYFIWHAVFSSQPLGARIHGFSFEEMVTYVSIGWLSRSFYFSDIDYEIDEVVRNGQIGIYLLRPVNFQLMMLAQAFGGILFRGLFFSVPIGFVLFLVYPILLPTPGISLWGFFFSTFMAFLVLAQTNFIIGLLAFSFKSIEGVIRAKYYLIQLLSGLLLPLAFFPDWARQVLDALPFKIISHVPLQFYLGHIAREEMIGVFLNQIFWAVILFVAGALLWRRMLGKLTVQGG